MKLDPETGDILDWDHKGRHDSVGVGGVDLCECGHERSAHFNGRMSCVHGSKEWCKCEKYRKSVPIGKVTSLEDRVALLEGLLREYRVSEYEHDEDCRAGVSTVTGYVYDNRCDICKRTDAALAPPTAPEDGK
jgi:hypothetical protein